MPSAGQLNKRPSKLVLALFFLYVVTFFLQLGSRQPWLGSIRIEFLLAAILAPIAVIRLLADSNTDVRYTRLKGNNDFKVLLILFIGLVTLRAFVTIDPAQSWFIYVNRFLKFSVMGLIISAFCRTPLGIKVFLAAFLLSCLKMGQEGLVGVLSGSMIWENQGVPRLHGSTRLYAHPNSFAGMALGTLPFVWYLFKPSTFWIRILLIALALLSLNIIVFSGSRTAYVGLAFLVMYLALGEHEKVRSKVFAIILALLMAAMLVPSEYQDRFATIFTGQEIEGDSMGSRRQLLIDSVDIFLERPLGVGVGAFQKARKERFGRMQDTHNLYLEVGTNIGVPGLVLFVLLNMIAYRRLRQTAAGLENRKTTSQKEAGLKGAKLNDAPKQLDRSNDVLVAAVCNATALYLMVRLVLGLFGHDLYEIYWWVVWGLFLATTAIFRSKEMGALVEAALPRTLRSYKAASR